MAHKYNLYFAMIFEKEELDHRGRQFVSYLQFCTDNITNFNHLLSFEDSKPNSRYNSSSEVPQIETVIAKAEMY